MISASFSTAKLRGEWYVFVNRTVKDADGQAWNIPVASFPAESEEAAMDILRGIYQGEV